MSSDTHSYAVCTYPLGCTGCDDIDDSDFDGYIDRTVGEHEMFLASEGANHLFEGRGE